jgi:hypothetical protein
MTEVRIGAKGISLVAASFVSLLAASAANAGPLYLSYQDSVQLQSAYTGDNAPTIVNSGLAKASQASPDAINTTSTLSARQLLFQVDPNACVKSGSGCAVTSGPLDATVSVTFSFYSGPGGSLLGTLTDTAQADFLYTGLGQGTDNICWQNSGVSTSLTLVSDTQTGTCSTTKSLNSGTGNEQITFLLGAVDYTLQLDNWTDWNEQPGIQFESVPAPPPPAPVPEPLTLSLFAAGLAGATALRRRKAKKA